PGESIFTRKRKLATSTLERIFLRLRKFGGAELEPWLVILRRHMNGKPITGPLPTICTNGRQIGLAQSFLVTVSHGLDGHGLSHHVAVRPCADINEDITQAFYPSRQGLCAPHRKCRLTFQVRGDDMNPADTAFVLVRYMGRYIARSGQMPRKADLDPSLAKR